MHTKTHTKMRIKASPLARHMARENNLSLSVVTGTGSGGRIIKRDIDAALKNGAGTPPFVTQSDLTADLTADLKRVSSLPDPRLFFDEDEYKVEPLSPMMASIATRLQQAKQEVPHYQVSMDVAMDGVNALRRKLNMALAQKDTGEKLTLNDFIIRAAGLSLIEVPEINSGFAINALIRFKNADVSVAVALPGGGIITPIIKAAQTKSVRDIAREIKDLAKRASEMRLKPEEYEGGTFSVSNLGMFGVSDFNAIINPPQSAILAVGASLPRVEMKNGHPIETQIMRVTLSSDHRVINGAQAATFLGVFKAYMEQPMDLLF